MTLNNVIGAGRLFEDLSLGLWPEYQEQGDPYTRCLMPLHRSLSLSGRLGHLSREEVINCFNETFDGSDIGCQKDPHDMLLLMMGIVNSINSNDDIFSLVLEGLLVCQSCSHVSTSPGTEPETCLTLYIPPNTVSSDINTLIDNYFQMEDVERDCRKCRSKVASKGSQIGNTPKVLVLQLARYCNDNTKCRTPIKANSALNIIQHASATGSELSYQLRAIIAHQGETTDSGHYTTTIVENGCYLEVNDDSTELSTPEDSEKDSYIIVYEHVPPLM